MENELEYLQKIKEQLLTFGDMGISLDDAIGQINKLVIKSDDWHKIFKTDEFNKLKENG